MPLEPDGLPPFNETTFKLWLKGVAECQDELVRQARAQTQLLQAILVALTDGQVSAPVKLKSRKAVREAAAQEIGQTILGKLFGRE